MNGVWNSRGKVPEIAYGNVADEALAIEINRAGYATDPSYASKLIGLMDRYDLYRYDQV